MTARLSFGRTLAVAGIVTAVAVPLSAGSAFADPKPNTPPSPTQSDWHHAQVPGHDVGHHPQVPGHDLGHHPQVPGHDLGHHPQPGPHHDVVTTLRTRMRDAHIRISPAGERHGRTLSTLRARGSRVAVTCWTTGTRVHGSSVWFQTVAPARGYISSSEVGRPAHPVGRCR